MKNTYHTDSGMLCIWNYESFKYVNDYDSWDKELCEDDDILKNIKNNSFVPLNLGDGAFEVEIRINEASFSEREKEYLLVPSQESELLIKMFKKGSGIPSVNWNEVVIELLCWGWIDGVKKSLDDQAYLQRITPRKARSNCSKRNTEHVDRLIIEGRMKEPGACACSCGERRRSLEKRLYC